MKVSLIWVGRSVDQWLVTAIDDYASRLKHYLSFDIKEIPALKNAKNLSHDQIKTKEGELILASFLPGDHIVLLDENGAQFTSRNFSERIAGHMGKGTKRVVFVIGGAFGFSSPVYAAAHEKMSLSKLTFSHQMVRAIFLEQLYRANTIIKGEPYHHD